MKTQELNEKELKEINGGGLFGGNDSHNEGGLGGALGIGNLLSFSSSSKDGDESSSSSFSLGNGINLDLAGITKSMTE
ncbi:MAG: bacteriocin [Sphingobacteriaceae bacterium]|nr:MAG: bacteriocin [Sphingobacteriaceae bacterium]